MSVSLSPRLRHLGAATIALACVAALSRGADAAQPASVKPAKPEVAWASADPETASCGRSRRKLWQAGEGWVVKTVTICR